VSIWQSKCLDCTDLHIGILRCCIRVENSCSLKSSGVERSLYTPFDRESMVNNAWGVLHRTEVFTFNFSLQLHSHVPRSTHRNWRRRGSTTIRSAWGSLTVSQDICQLPLGEPVERVPMSTTRLIGYGVA